MAYEINLNLPSEWRIAKEQFTDESGVEISHLEAQEGDPKNPSSIIDVYVGEMPEDETAEDQAFANYAETVGFDDDDEECPITKFKFNGKSAWGFEAFTENEQPMRFISQEVRKGVLAIIVYCTSSDEQLNPTLSLIERSLRIR